MMGEPLPSRAEPGRISVAHRDLHRLEHHRAQTGKSPSICADGAPNQDLHTPDSSMRPVRDLTGGQAQGGTWPRLDR
jgi:hypothetical protein